MAVFNQTQYSNLTNITQIFDVAEVFTDGYLGFGIWLMISFGVLFIMSSFNSKDAFIGATFVALISALFLAYLGMLSGVFVMVSLILFTFSIILSIISKGGGGA